MVRRLEPYPADEVLAAMSEFKIASRYKPRLFDLTKNLRPVSQSHVTRRESPYKTSIARSAVRVNPKLNGLPESAAILWWHRGIWWLSVMGNLRPVLEFMPESDRAEFIERQTAGYRKSMTMQASRDFASAGYDPAELIEGVFAPRQDWEQWDEFARSCRVESEPKLYLPGNQDAA
jgi:hypothetical protein